jgi:plasmid segregation protein ParM
MFTMLLHSGLEPQDVHLYVTLPLSQFYTALVKPMTKTSNGKRQPDEAG